MLLDESPFRVEKQTYSELDLIFGGRRQFLCNKIKQGCEIWFLVFIEIMDFWFPIILNFNQICFRLIKLFVFPNKGSENYSNFVVVSINALNHPLFLHQHHATKPEVVDILFLFFRFVVFLFKLQLLHKATLTWKQAATRNLIWIRKLSTFFRSRRPHIHFWLRQLVCMVFSVRSLQRQTADMMNEKT